MLILNLRDIIRMFIYFINFYVGFDPDLVLQSYLEV